MLGILGLLELIIGAGILGIIIAVMEEGEFPGWSPMIVCLLAASIPAAIVNAVLPPNLFFVGLAVGAVCAGFAISAMCGMSVKRATIAVSIYLAIRIGISLLFVLMIM